MRERIRIGFFEEWPSLRAVKILPYLAKKFEITYVTSDKGAFPDADFADVRMYPAPKYINQRGLAFSRLADVLYSEGRIDLAVHYAGISFLTRKVPIINFLGGSYYTDFKVKWIQGGLLNKIRLFVGFLHYVVPEYIGYRSADRLIANSESLKNELEGHYRKSGKQFDVVYNGIDSDFSSLGKDKVLSATPKILFIGRLHCRKGILELVKAFHKRDDIQAPLLIAGDGPDRDSIAAICQDDNRIRLLGHLSKERLIQEMNETTMFVFPSFHEGCPNALLEAMASRHACLCYDIPPVREVLNGAGILCEVGDPEALCDRLAELVMAPAQVNRLANQAFVKSGDFTWEKCAMQLEEIIRDFYAELSSA